MNTSNRLKSLLLPGAAFFLLILFADLPQTALAHGVAWEAAPQPAKALLFRYSDGTAMRYAAIKTFSPADAKIEHQQGHSDKNGRFAFVPDVPGDWRILASDGLGHRVEAVVNVAADEMGENRAATDPLSPAAPGRWSAPLWARITVGFSLLLNAFGAAHFFRNRKKRSGAAIA